MNNSDSDSSRIGAVTVTNRPGTVTVTNRPGTVTVTLIKSGLAYCILVLVCNYHSQSHCHCHCIQVLQVLLGLTALDAYRHVS